MFINIDYFALICFPFVMYESTANSVVNNRLIVNI